MKRELSVVSCDGDGSSMGHQRDGTDDSRCCEDNLQAIHEVVDGRTLAVWLSGYYSAQRGTTVVDIPDLQAKADVVREYCFRHYHEPLMEAVKKALGVNK